MPSGEEIQAALTKFVARWGDYAGTEKSEAQTFLNDLFACYGTDRRDVAEFEFFSPGGFMDLHWPEVCLIEMKAPTVGVQTAQQQAERYWPRGIVRTTRLIADWFRDARCARSSTDCSSANRSSANRSSTNMVRD